MAQRQVGQDHVTGVRGRVVEAAAIDDDVAGELDVGVGEHGALGWTGGARRVDERHDVARLGPLGDAVEGARIRLAMCVTAREELLPAHELGVVDRGDATWLEVDDVLECRALGLDEECLVDLLLVLGDEDARAGVGEQVGDLGCRISGVETDSDAAHGVGAQVREEPFGSVLGVNRDAVSRLDAQRKEPVADKGHLVRVVGPGDVTPDAQPLGAHRDPVGGDLGAALHGSDERPRARDGLCHRGHRVSLPASLSSSPR